MCWWLNCNIIYATHFKFITFCLKNVNAAVKVNWAIFRFYELLFLSWPIYETYSAKISFTYLFLLAHWWSYWHFWPIFPFQVPSSGSSLTTATWPLTCSSRTCSGRPSTTPSTCSFKNTDTCTHRDLCSVETNKSRVFTKCLKSNDQSKIRFMLMIEPRSPWWELAVQVCETRKPFWGVLLPLAPSRVEWQKWLWTCQKNL